MSDKADDEQGRKKRRVMLVDDHPLVREGIAGLIRCTHDLEVVSEVGTVEQALRQLEQGLPDLILLDITLPGPDGIELLKVLRDRYPAARVLVLSMHEESVYAERALKAGACGYIIKQETGLKVVEAIRCVLQGFSFVSESLAARLSQAQGVTGRQRGGPVASVASLSDRELQVYSLIGKGKPSKLIARQLDLSIKTVQTHREHIKRKLGLKHASELVHHATHWVENEMGEGAGAGERARVGTAKENGRIGLKANSAC